MSYEPPRGYKVGLTFVNGFEVPPGYRVGLEFVPGDRPVGDVQYLFPAGSESLVVGMASFALHHHFIPLQGIRAGDIGAPRAWLSNQHVYPRGGFYFTSGRPAIWLQDRYIRTTGIRPSVAFGRHALESTTKEIKLGGIYPPQQSTRHFVENHLKIFYPVGVRPTLVVGRPSITNWYQWVEQRPYGSIGGVGRLSIRDRNRFITPNGLNHRNGFGKAVIWREQRVEGAGGIHWEFNRFGSHHIGINLQRMYPVGFYSSTVPRPTVFNYIQNIAVRTLGDLSEFYNHDIWNRDSNINVPRADDPVNFISSYRMSVSLKDKYSSVPGFLSQRFSPFPARIWLYARDVRAGGMHSLEFPAADVSHGVRSVPTEGFSAEVVSRFTAIYNTARQLVAKGWTSSLPGTPAEVLNLNRTIHHYNVSDMGLYGVAFIAPRVRGIHQHGSVVPHTPTPDVRHNPHPVSPLGFLSADRRFGNSKWFTRRMEIFPKPGKNPGDGVVGYPAVANRNREYFFIGKDMSEFGGGVVYNYIRDVPLSGFRSMVWGTTFIGRRDRPVFPRGILALVLPNTHRIHNVLPDPPPNLTVYPEGIYDGGVGVVGTNYRTIRPVGIDSAFRAGKTDLWYGGVEPRSVTFSEAFGVLRLENTLRSVAARSVQGVPVVGRPRVTPHTVYAPSGDSASAQARANHPGRSEIVDEYLHRLGKLGYPVVSNQYRHARVYGIAPTSRYIPRPRVFLFDREIIVSGIRSLRFNIPDVFGGDFKIDLTRLGFISSRVGPPTVKFPPHSEKNRAVYPAGVRSQSIPRQRISLLHRGVGPRGIAHNPNFFGTGMVGYPRRVHSRGQVLSLWGDTKIDFRVRHIYPEGEVHTGWEIEDVFHQLYKTTVSLAGGRPNAVKVEGVYQGFVGGGEVSHIIRTVYPHGFSPYILGPYSVAMTISPIGWNSIGFGDVHQYKLGELQVRGRDSLDIGSVDLRSLSGVQCIGVSSLQFGRPSTVPSISPPGYNGGGTSRPVVVSGGCYALIVANAGVDSEEGFGDLWIR